MGIIVSPVKTNSSEVITSITDIYCLSIEELENVISSVPNIPIEQNDRWWLRSSGSFVFSAAYVLGDDGTVYERGLAVGCKLGVRPAFRIPYIAAEGLIPGDKIIIGEHTVCTVIAPGVVFADNIICKHRFDKASSIWETSELRQYLKSDDFKF